MEYIHWFPTLPSRTPHGVRGLKLSGVVEVRLPFEVAPLTGCVD